MSQPFNIYHFSLSSSQEVDDIVKKISSVADKYLIIHVASFIHNTVLVHNLKTALERNFEQAKITLLPAAREDNTIVTIFTCNACHNDAILLQDELIQQLQNQSRSFQTELSSSRSQLLKRYFRDSLTNLPNLYQLRNDLQEHENATYILFNIDNFNLISDFYGYIVGDYILEVLAQTLAEIEHQNGVYRINSNQFAMMLPEQMDFYSLKEYIQALSDKLNNQIIEYHKTVIYVDITLASTSSRDHGDIFSKISMALNHALELNLPFWIYEDRMNFEKIYENNLNLSVKIRKAIENEQIVPYFQPIIENSTGDISKFECLSRLIDEDGIVLAPAEFLGVAKKIKVYSIVTKTIINKSFEIFKDIEYDFTINLAIEDIMNHEIYSFIVNKLRTSGIGHRVTFELLETEGIEDFKKISRFITEIKRFNAKIAIDDFGSGFSNFAYLAKIDVDYIKIDGSIIQDIDTNENSRIVTETIVEFAKKLGVKTVAEYVHSSTILAKVKALGIDFSQGYAIDKPQPDLHL